MKVNLGQPVSHRLDHMMSGIRSQIAVKLYGRDIEELRDRGQDIAEMIEEQDAKGLSSLPGVGGATADRIIAKLRRKMSKFALLVARAEDHAADVKRDVLHDAFEALRLLGHPDADASKLIDGVIKTKRKFPDVEAVLHVGGGDLQPHALSLLDPDLGRLDGEAAHQRGPALLGACRGAAEVVAAASRRRGQLALVTTAS